MRKQREVPLIEISFSEAEIAALHYERFHHPHPRVQRKMEALYLKSQGLPHWEIAQLLQVSQNTLRSYLKDYQAGGIAGLKVLTFYQPQSELKPHQATLEAQFRAHPPQSLAQAAAKIEALTGIRRSRSQVQVFLRGMGMKCRRVGVLPAKADPEAQEAYRKTSWSLA